MGIKTRITEKFGIETPIIMGGMTGVGYGPLVAAVANAARWGSSRHICTRRARHCSTRSRRPES